MDDEPIEEFSEGTGFAGESIDGVDRTVLAAELPKLPSILEPGCNPENVDRKVWVDVGSVIVGGYTLGDRAEGTVAVAGGDALPSTPFRESPAAVGDDDTASGLSTTLALPGSI